MNKKKILNKAAALAVTGLVTTSNLVSTVPVFANDENKPVNEANTSEVVETPVDEESIEQPEQEVETESVENEEVVNEETVEPEEEIAPVQEIQAADHVFAVDDTYTKVDVISSQADSVEPTGENGGLAQHAFDGDQSTVWHTLWSSEGQKTMPHWISYSFSEVVKLGRIDYVGKPAMNGVGNGVFKDIDIYVSEDENADPTTNEGWTLAATFNGITYDPATGTATNRAKTFTFEPVNAKKVKILVRGSYSSGSGTEEENLYANALEIINYSVKETEKDNLPITATIDGKSYTADSLQKIVEFKNIDTSKVKELKIDSGNIEYEDLEYLNGGSYFRFRFIEKLTIDLTKATMYNEAGEKTTELPGGSPGSMQNLKELHLPGVTKIGYRYFQNAGTRTTFKVLDIPDVTTIEQFAFQNCRFGFSTLNLPKVQVIGTQAFDNAQFKTIQLDSIQSIGDEAFKSASVSELTLPATLTELGHNAIMLKENAQVTLLAETPPTTPTTSGWYPFGSKAYTLTVPNKSYDISKFGPENKVTLVVDGEEEQTISGSINGNPVGGDSLEDMVNNASESGYVTNWNFVTDLTLTKGTLTEDDLFYITNKKTKKLVNVVMDIGGDLQYAEDNKKIPNNFLKSCTSLESISLAGWTTLGEMSLYGTKKLKSVNIPDVETIEYDGFGGSGIEAISLPKVKSMGKNAFSSCANLSSIDMPVVETIGDSAFYRCTKLTTIVFPETLKTIGSARIGYLSGSGDSEKCNVLDITFKGEVPPTMEEKSFQGAVGSVLHVPDNAIEAYSALMNEYFKNITLDQNVDKSNLQAFYDEVKDYTSDDSLYNKFTDQLEVAKNVLENAGASQDEVDKALSTLEQRYWLSKVNKYVGTYSSKKFEYTQYTLESCKEVLGVYLEASNHTNTNYPTEKLQKLYDRFVEAEKKLVLVTDKIDVVVGPTEKQVSTSYTGTFTVSGKQVGNKIQLHIEYRNDGKHPLNGEDVKAFTASEIKKAYVDLEYATYSGEGGITSIKEEKLPLEGETSLSKGFQMDVLVDPGAYSVSMESDSKKAGLTGTYYTISELADMTAPEVTVSYSNEGLDTNQDVTVILKANEAINDIEGWTRVDETTLTKVFSENGSHTIIVTDLAGNTKEEIIDIKGIDKVAPVINGVTDGTITNENVTYSVKEENVAKIIVDGVEYTEESAPRTIEKEGKHVIQVIDKAGNETIVNFEIDRIKPEVFEVLYSTKEPAEEVTVTITTSEQVKDIEGWTQKARSVSILTKTFTENTEEVVVVEDLAGNKSDPITISIKNIGVNEPPVIIANDITLTVGDSFNAMANVSAKDKDGTNITTSIQVVKDDVDTSKPGVYEVTYSVTDSYGASCTKTITVTVNPKAEVLNHIPTITAEDKTLTVGDKFNDKIAKKDVTANDKEDGDLTRAIEVIKNTVDTSKAGTYEVTYKVTDSKGASCTKTITVTVNPKMETLNQIPKIYAKEKTITVGDEFEPLRGVRAIDKEDGNITTKIKVVKNDVDTTTPGIYEVTYKVTDKDGASSTKTITVTVNPKAEELNSIPTISAQDKTLIVGDVFDPMANVTANDEEDGDLTDSIEIINNTVDTTVAGTYEVTYKVTDSKGASSTKTITVTVNPKAEELNHIPFIFAQDKTLTVGDVFNTFDGVSAYDIEDGNITTSIEVINNTVDTSVAGSYQVTYRVTDKDGASSVRTITVVVNPKMETLNSIPTINAQNKTLTVGDKFDETIAKEGVTALDREDGVLTDKILVIKNEVDTSKAGTYEVTYFVTDSQGASCAKTITVTVNPKVEELNSIPTISAQDKTLTVGDAFDPMADVSASDEEDGDLTASIEVINNTVDTTVAGTYEVTYKVTDSQGASCVKTIIVTVNPKMEVLNSIPTIHAEDKTLTVGDAFDPMKDVSASDEEDGDLTASIEIVNNTVDTTKAGTYEVTYKVTDSQGASSTKTIKVTVKKKASGSTDKEDTNKKDDTKKTTSTKTSVFTNLGLFSGLVTTSLSGIGILELLKRKRK